MTGNPLKRLLELGQSPWLDYIHRRLLENGELERMIERWGLSGMTSNPTIFDKALGESEYEADIARLMEEGLTAGQIYERLVVADVRAAAECFGPVHGRSDGRDGYVSLEVSPHLARDTDGTIAEAKRLFAALDRPNVMIKVPGTREGLSALRALIAEGINVNVTLLFSVERYRAVVGTYLEGLEAALEANRPISGITSVASFFLSRIDTAVDKRLDEIAGGSGDMARDAATVRGETAIACAHAAYAVLEEVLASERFRWLAERGAQVQRLLWASTGTKDPAYSPTKYVDSLIGPHTVNTMPLATLEAYASRGSPTRTLPGEPAHIQRVFGTLKRLDIDLEQVMSGLLEEGIDKFVQPYDASISRLQGG